MRRRQKQVQSGYTPNRATSAKAAIVAAFVGEAAVANQNPKGDAQVARATAESEQGGIAPHPEAHRGGIGSELARIAIFGETPHMSATEIIEQFKALPPEERAEVARFVVANDDSWVPDEFKEAMEDLEAGRLVDMEIVMSGAKPPPRPVR